MRPPPCLPCYRDTSPASMRACLMLNASRLLASFARIRITAAALLSAASWLPPPAMSRSISAISARLRRFARTSPSIPLSVKLIAVWFGSGILFSPSLSISYPERVKSATPTHKKNQTNFKGRERQRTVTPSPLGMVSGFRIPVQPNMSDGER